MNLQILNIDHRINHAGRDILLTMVIAPMLGHSRKRWANIKITL